MTTRYREIDARVRIDGEVERVFWTGGSYTYEIWGYRGRRTVCGDTVGEYETDNGLSIDHRLNLLSVMEGTYVEGPVARRNANHCPVQGIAQYSVEDPRGPHGLPNFGNEAVGWIGRMQPGEAHFGLPTFLGEAKDIPSLITQFPSLVRDWGMVRLGKHASKAEQAKKIAQTAASSLGSTHLWATFGVSPAKQDLLAMLGILEAFLRNLERLQSLAAGGSIKRSIRLSPYREVHEDGIFQTHSAGVSIKHIRVRVLRKTDWVTSRWVPIFPWDYVGDKPSSLVAKAMRQTLGLNPSGLLQAWWELLPWSWLVDWIANIQARLRLFGGNSLGLQCESLCYCRTCTVDVYWGLAEAPEGITFTGRDFHQRVTKERFPIAGADINYAYTPSLPALTGSQAGILGALVGQYLGR
jgi:hypothetical protein